MYSPPISVCFVDGCSSWYRHMRLRSASVRVFLGVEDVREPVEVADIGVEIGPTGTGIGAGAEGYIGGT